MAPCFKKYFKIRSWVPSPQMPYSLNNQQVTRTQHTRQKQRRHRERQNSKTLTLRHRRKNLLTQRREKIPPGFGLIRIIIRDRNNFSARDKRPAITSNAASKQLQSGVRSRRTSCPRSSSSRVRGTRRGAGSATCSRWRTSGARSSSSGSLTWRCTWHSASSRTCAKIRQQRRQHQGQAHEEAR